MTSGALIRAARRPEIDALSAPCLRSKAHWGYDEAFMALCVPTLRVSAGAIANALAFVAEVERQPSGVLQLEVKGARAELDLLFVDPPTIGAGIGRRLYRHAEQLATARGCRELSIVADPFACPFYAARGARYVEDVPSDSIPGRMLPRYVHVLGSSR